MYSKEQQKAIASGILAKCIEISNTKKADIFFHYSPHINGMEVDIHLNGWSKNHSSDKGYRVYFDWEIPEEVESKIQELNKVLDELIQ
jgi:hypothetical protein